MVCYNDSISRLVKFVARNTGNKISFGTTLESVRIFRYNQMWSYQCGGIHDFSQPPGIFTEEVIAFVYSFNINICYVYFGGRFGYLVEYDRDFMERLKGEVVPNTEEIKEISKVYETNNS